MTDSSIQFQVGEYPPANAADPCFSTEAAAVTHARALHGQCIERGDDYPIIGVWRLEDGWSPQLIVLIAEFEEYGFITIYGTLTRKAIKNLRAYLDIAEDALFSDEQSAATATTDDDTEAQEHE